MTRAFCFLALLCLALGAAGGPLAYLGAGRLGAVSFAAPDAKSKVRKTEVTFDTDEGPRADTTLEGLQGLNPVLGPDTSITAGNAIDIQVSNVTLDCNDFGLDGLAAGLAIALAWGTVVGSALQFGIQIPTVWPLLGPALFTVIA